MATEIPLLYRSLKKTEKTKPEFKKKYNKIRQRLISEGKFKSTDGKPLNAAILTEMGEYPYWKRGRGNPQAVPFGEGEFHQMSGGDARPFSVRKPSQAKATKIRQDRLKKANELMTAFGLEDEVNIGKAKFDKTTKTPKGMAWDHKWEVQDFGSKYEKLIEEFASGSINEKQFKSLLSDHVSKSPGDIQRNLELKPQSENLAKEARTRAILKQEALADKYAVKDAKYTEFQKLDDVTKASKLEEAHKQAVKFTKYDFASQLAAEAPDYKVTKVVDKAKPVIDVFKNKGVRTALKFGVPGVYLGFSVLNMQSKAAVLELDDTWQNKAQYGIAGAETALEGFELATGGLGAIVTTPLQIGLTLADQLIHQTEDSFQRSETDWDARRAARRGQR